MIIQHDKKLKAYYFKSKKEVIKAFLFSGKEQKKLFDYACNLRDEVFSKKIEVRSVIEYSNVCEQSCNFCGMNKHSKIPRYVLTSGEFLECVDKLYGSGRRVILIEAGENKNNSYFNKLCGLLKKVKEKYSDLVLNCSLGNLSENKYRKLREIGVKRYLIKFETSNSALYRKIKPLDILSNRIAHINMAKKLGFQVSSGSIVGLPGQSLNILAEDLFLIKKLGLPMGGVSPFIPNQMAPYARYPNANLNLTLKFMAIMRIMCPTMLIPTVSALELIGANGQYLGLMAGANVITLHDGTPSEKEKKYIIYKIGRHRPNIGLCDVARNAGFECSNLPFI